MYGDNWDLVSSHVASLLAASAGRSSTRELPDPELVRRVDAEVESWSLSVGHHAGQSVSGAELAIIAQRVSEEIGAPIGIAWTPYGLRGYPLASLSPAEHGRRRVSDKEAYDGLRVERGRWRLADAEARESYARFLRQEIGRMGGGGAHPPWMTREQAIEVLERELADLDRGAP